MTERNALLFVAGTYPKKGANGSTLTITESDLKAIAANTGAAPLIFAHDAGGETLHFGVVSALVARGKELWGKISLTPAAASFVAENGLKSLSVGLDYAANQLREVSFTRKPHIKNAALFSDTIALFSISEGLGLQPSKESAAHLAAHTQERIAQAAAQRKRLAEEPDSVKQSRHDALLAQTPEGRALLARRNLKDDAYEDARQWALKANNKDKKRKTVKK